jgi:hypothetical protein
LTVSQSQRFQVLQAALDGHMTNAQAAGALSKSVRQVQRLKARVRSLGPSGVRHGNAGRPPHNKLPPVLRQKILDLAASTYADYNFSHLARLSQVMVISGRAQILFAGIAGIPWDEAAKSRVG